MTMTSPHSDTAGIDVVDGAELDRSPRPCPEALQRVTATSADLVAQGRRVTVRELSRLTGLEPPVVEDCLAALVRRGVLQPAGAAPHHYVFAQGRWPVT